MTSYKPYLMCEDPTAKDRDIMQLLSAPKVSREVTNLSLSYGEDNTLAIAEIYDRLKSYNIELMGAGTAMYGQRLKGFAEAVGQYQQALLDYRDTIKGKASSASKTLARQCAIKAFQRLQQGFKHELNAVTSSVKAGRRGTPLTSAIRGTNIARSSRNVASLNITSRVQASQLARLGKHTKFLGNGVALMAAAYVELIPVKAKKVRKPEDYRWSSACVHIKGKDPPGIVEPGKLLDIWQPV